MMRGTIKVQKSSLFSLLIILSLIQLESEAKAGPRDETSTFNRLSRLSPDWSTQNNLAPSASL